MIYTASFLPILLYILLLKLMDSFSIVRWKRLLLCLLLGASSCLATYFISRITGGVEIGDVSVIPVFEEILKGGIMVFLVMKGNIKFLAETLIYGAAVGGGFALAENTFYLAANPDMLAGTAVFRGFGCAFLHIGCTALVSALTLILKNNKPVALFTALSFLPSCTLHILHNRMILSPVVQLAVTIGVFFVIFLVLFNLGEKKIYNWMDHSISIDIQTLSSIKAGNFSTTKAGQFLLDVKEQFQPEVFFDMVNCVELYLELKIEKQSRMLMKQAGFDLQDSEEDERSFSSRSRELAELKRFIGKTGCSVLKPLVHDDI